MFINYIQFLSIVLAVIQLQGVLAVATYRPKIVCYYGTWAAERPEEGNYNIDDIDPFKCTHLIYAFVGINADGTLNLLNPTLDSSDNGGYDLLTKFNNLKLVNTELKTLVAIGGWNEGTTNFSTVAAYEELRVTFTNSVIDFLVKYNFSGCDIAWDYPTTRNNLTFDDRTDYSSLLKRLNHAFQPYKFLLSVAVNAARGNAENFYTLPRLAKFVDFINIMAFDLHIGTESYTGYNAPLYPPQTYVNGLEEQYNDQDIVDFWLTVAPAKKVVLGVPFYGHTFILANASENTAYCPSAGPGPAGQIIQQRATVTYNELCIEWLTKNYTYVFDDAQGVPYCYLDSTWVSYDNPKSIALKAELVAKNKLGGIMIWSLESDDIHGNCGYGKSPLLQTINDVLKNTSD